MLETTGLPKQFLALGRDIAKRVSRKPLVQPLGLGASYQLALQLSSFYQLELETFTHHESRDHDLVFKYRPGGVKSPARILEKAFHEVVPLDLLGGKIICPSLERIYQIGASIVDTFKTVGFKDRFAAPQSTGYRDLQFQVEIEQGHIAELKVVHNQINELDEIEHRLYQISRMLSHKLTTGEINIAENMVREELQKTSRKLYNSIWRSILVSEVKL